MSEQGICSRGPVSVTSGKFICKVIVGLTKVLLLSSIDVIVPRRASIHCPQLWLLLSSLPAFFS